MVERSRRTKEAVMEDRATRMVFATAALAAVAAVLAGPAGAYIPEGDGVNAVAAQSQVRQAQAADNLVIPYLSHGVGVDESQFAGQPSRRLAGGQAAAQGVDVAISTAIEARSEKTSVAAPTIPYLSQGMGVDRSQFGGRVSQRVPGPHAALALNRHENASVAPLPHGIQVELSRSSQPQSLGLTGDSPLTRVSAPEPEGLTGDAALTRVPETTSVPTVSGGEDIDWTSFGAGAGMVALVAAGLAGVLLMARRRHTIGLP
jgi:hypothetical protein